MTIEDNIIKIVSDKIGVDITERNRGREYVLGRAMYCEIVYSKLQLRTLASTGSLLGIDHASVIHLIRKVFPQIKSYYKNHYVKYLSILKMIGIDEKSNKPVSIEDRYNDLIDNYERLSSDYEYVLSFMNLDRSNPEFNELVQSIVKLPEDKISKLKVRVDAIIHML